MGVSINAQTSKQNYGYIEAVHNIMSVIHRRAVSPFYFNDLTFKLTPLGREQQRTLKELHGFTEKVSWIFPLPIV